MTSQRLSNGPVSVAPLDVVGEDSHATQCPDFVRHVGLALEAVNGLTVGVQVDVVHMRPPFENPGRMTADVVGSVPLSSDQQIRVEMFLDNVDGEFKTLHKRIQFDLAYKHLSFVVRPHVMPAQQDSLEYNRYSCVGFVIEAYRSAGLRIIDTDEASLQPVSRQTVQEAYELPDFLFDDADLAAHFGLDAGKSWRVVLPSYVFHALDRPYTEIQRGYRAQPQDDTYP